MNDVLVKNLKGLKEDELLANYTTFKIGGPAKYFFEAENEEEIVRAVKFAREFNLPYLILGGCSNVLVSDDGFSGLVIKVKNNKIEFDGEEIIAGAGVNLTKLAVQSVKQGLAGLEWAAGIPGTVGGAVYGNAGAWGGEIKDSLQTVKVLRGVEIKELKKEECGFAYRHSIFKSNDDVILEARFILEKGDKKKSEELITKYLKAKTESQATDKPSSGCIFKNIKFDELDAAALEKVKPLLDADLLKRQIVPAGLLIDEAGYKGFKMGKVAVSEKHANFIINLGGGTAEEVIMLIAAIKQKVRVMFNIQLHEEVQLVGF